MSDAENPVDASEEAIYDPDGAPLIAEITATYAAIAMRYELQLFRADGTRYFPFAGGTTADTVPDSHVIPGDKHKHHHRIVLGAAEVGPLNEGDPYRVELNMYQGADLLASDARQGEAGTDEISIFVQPAIRLVDRTELEPESKSKSGTESPNS